MNGYTIKVGDLVRQAPNIFADRKLGGKPMLVLKLVGVNGDGGVVTLCDGQPRRWHRGELEKV